MELFDWVFNAILSREHRERTWQVKWDKSIAAAAAKLRLESNTAPSISSPLPTSYSKNLHYSPTRELINYDGLMTLPAKKTHKPSNEAAQSSPLYPLPPLGPMEGIGKDRRSVNVTDEYLSMLRCNTLAALQPLISDRDRASRFNTNTTSPPPVLVAMQLGTVEVPGKSGSAVKDNSRPVLAATGRRAPGGNRRRGRGGVKTAAGRTQGPRAQGGARRGVKARQGTLLACSMETLVSGK
jgi:hypothetical protein